MVYVLIYLAVSVTSPMVPGGLRNIHEGKVPGQLTNATNHLSDRHGTEDYLNIVHHLSNEVRLKASTIVHVHLLAKEESRKSKISL